MARGRALLRSEAMGDARIAFETALAARANDAAALDGLFATLLDPDHVQALQERADRVSLAKDASKDAQAVAHLWLGRCSEDSWGWNTGDQFCSLDGARYEYQVSLGLREDAAVRARFAALLPMLGPSDLWNAAHDGVTRGWEPFALVPSRKGPPPGCDDAPGSTRCVPAGEEPPALPAPFTAFVEVHDTSSGRDQNDLMFQVGERWYTLRPAADRIGGRYSYGVTVASERGRLVLRYVYGWDSHHESSEQQGIYVCGVEHDVPACVGPIALHDEHTDEDSAATTNDCEAHLGAGDVLEVRARKKSDCAEAGKHKLSLAAPAPIEPPAPRLPWFFSTAPIAWMAGVADAADMVAGLLATSAAPLVEVGRLVLEYGDPGAVALRQGRAKLAAGDLVGALAAADAVIAATKNDSPLRAGANALIGKVLESQGNVSGAWEAYETAVRYVNDPEVRAAMDALAVPLKPRALEGPAIDPEAFCKARPNCKQFTASDGKSFVFMHGEKPGCSRMCGEFDIGIPIGDRWWTFVDLPRFGMMVTGLTMEKPFPERVLFAYESGFDAGPQWRVMRRGVIVCDVGKVDRPSCVGPIEIHEEEGPLGGKAERVGWDCAAKLVEPGVLEITGACGAAGRHELAF
jgi:hypothetical protein